MEFIKLYTEIGIECLSGDTVGLKLDAEAYGFTPEDHTMECRIASAYMPNTLITTVPFTAEEDGFVGDIPSTFTSNRNGLYNLDLIMDASGTPQMVARVYLNIKRSTS